MKQFLKVVIWVVILGAVFFGVYTALPDYPQSIVKSFVQPVINKDAKTRINQVKQLINQKENASYQKILETYTNTSGWVYAKDEVTGVETVSFYGKGATINIKDIPKYEDKLYTSCAVRFDFQISGSSVKIIAYIDGEMQDDTIRDLMIHQLNIGTKG